MMSDEKSSDTNRAFYLMWLVYDDHVKLLDSAFKLTETEDDRVWKVARTLWYGAIQTCQSIGVLAVNERLRETFVLARMAFETLLNANFVFASGEEMARRAELHSLQKSYRDLKRSLETNFMTVEIAFSGREEVSSINSPELEEALDMFTNKRGREITKWTPETVKQKIEIINQKYGEKIGGGLLVSSFAIYRHASDIIHGTYFSILYSIGATMPSGPPKIAEDIHEHQKENLIMIMMMLEAAISDTLRIIASEKPELSELLHEADESMEQLRKEPWFSGDKNLE